MGRALGRFAIGWGSFLSVPSLVLLLVLDRGTAEFTVTLLTLGMGLFMVAAGVAWIVLAKHLETRPAVREPRARRLSR
jgi:uncharacterized membrane protein